MNIKYDKILDSEREKENSNEIFYDNTISSLTSSNVQDAIDEIDSVLDTVTNPLLFKGAISTSSNFPTISEVKIGWFYRILADVTDNNPAKTNTGQSFFSGDEIAWNGTNWTSLGSIKYDYVDFNLTPTVTMQEGRMAWDSTNGTVQVGMPGGNVNLQLGQEQHIRAKATENITNGQAVRISGASGSKPEMSLVNATENISVDTIAIATENITSGQNGYFTTFGLVQDINTNHLTEGASIYLDVTDGALTSTAPSHPSVTVCIGWCIVKSSTVGKIFVNINSKEWKNVFSAMQDPTGFEDRISSDWTFTDATLKLTVTVVSGSYRIWFDGVRHDITTTKEITITDAEGLHAIYFDTDDTLKEMVNPTIGQVLTFIRDKCAVAIIYWDATNKQSVLATEERHGTVMDGITHYCLHYTRGLQYIYGLALSDFVIGDGSLSSHAQFSVTEGSISDEDIGLTVNALASTTGMPILYRSGVNGYWRKLTQSGYSVYQNPSGTTNRLMYNQLTGGAWQLTEIGEGNYILCHVFTTTGKSSQLFSIMGQGEYTTIVLARTGATNEISKLLIGNLPVPEIRPVATVIFQTDKDYGNTINARVVEVSTGVNYVNWLTTDLPRGTTPSDHNSLSGLQLSQSGVEYGHINDGTQTIAGAKTFASAVVATTSLATPSILDNGADITIENNTSDKDIIFKVNDGGVDTEIMRIDGSASNVGIGITSPSAKLDVNGVILSSQASGNFPLQHGNLAIGQGGDTYSRGFSAGAMGIFNTSTTAQDIYLYNKNGADAGLFVLKANGNVGIGTTSPSEKLHVNGNNIRLTTATDRWVNFMYDPLGTAYTPSGAPGNNGYTGSRSFGIWSNGLGVPAGSTSGYIIKYDGKHLFLLEDSTGNVGIGTTSPQCKLDVPNMIRIGGTTSIVSPTSGNSIEQYYDDTGNKGVIQAYDRTNSTFEELRLYGNPLKINIDTSAPFYIGGLNSGAGTYPLKWNSSTKEVTYDTSSLRYKTNLRPIFDTSRVLDLTPKLFDRKDDGTKNDFGLIAEEVAEIMPELVVYRNNVPDGIKYDRMCVVLLEEIKKLRAEVNQLKGGN